MPARLDKLDADILKVVWEHTAISQKELIEELQARGYGKSLSQPRVAMRIPRLHEYIQRVNVDPEKKRELLSPNLMFFRIIFRKLGCPDNDPAITEFCHLIENKSVHDCLINTLHYMISDKEPKKTPSERAQPSKNKTPKWSDKMDLTNPLGLNNLLVEFTKKSGSLVSHINSLGYDKLAKEDAIKCIHLLPEALKKSPFYLAFSGLSKL